MAKTNIAAILTEIAKLLELKGENPFKIRAYQAGAHAIEALEETDLKARITAGTLKEVKGIGEALAQKITELETTGHLGFYEDLKLSLPPRLIEIMSVPGVGPKKVKALHEKLGIDTVPKLQTVCETGQLVDLAGFGEKTQQKILKGIRNREQYRRQYIWVEAWETAEPIFLGLRTLTQVQQVEVCGSLRRKIETIDSIDFLVATTEPKPTVSWFLKFPGVREVTAQGDTKTSVRLESGLQANLRLVPPECFFLHCIISPDRRLITCKCAIARLSAGFRLASGALFLRKTGERRKGSPSWLDKKPTSIRRNSFLPDLGWRLCRRSYAKAVVRSR